MNLERKNNYTLTFSAPGYTSSKFEITRSMRVGIVVADVLLTGLIGVIVDAATGAWYKLSPETVNVSLAKTDANAPGPDQLDIAIALRPGADNKTEVKIDPSFSQGVTVHVERR